MASRQGKRGVQVLGIPTLREVPPVINAGRPSIFGHVQPYHLSDLDTTHDDSTSLRDTHNPPLSDTTYGSTPLSAENYYVNGLLQHCHGDAVPNFITHLNDSLVCEPASSPAFSPNGFFSVNHNAIATDQEPTNHTSSDWLDELIEINYHCGDEFLFDRADTIHKAPSFAAATSSFSDQWQPDLEVDTLRVSEEGLGQSNNELYLPQHRGSSFANSHDVDSIMHVMSNFHQSSSPNRDLSSARDAEKHTGRQRSSMTSRHNRQCRTSVLREWLHQNGLGSYPDSDQIKELAATAGVTVKQARNALSNFRSRMHLKLEDDKSIRQISHTDTRHTKLHPKRKGRKQHVLRVSRNQQTPTASPSQISSEGGLDTSKTYYCTACPKSFENAYSWKRHETGVHGHSDTEWVCMLHGFVALHGECMFCHDHVVDMGHFELHNIPDCLEKDVYERTFARKDLLKQHIQQRHLAGTEESPSKAFQVPPAWEKEVDAMNIKSEALWCGFCTCMCDSVTDRMEHVAGHFRNGYDMDGWVHLTI